MPLRMIEVIAPKDAADGFRDMPESCKALGLWREPLDGNKVLLRALAESDQSEAIIAAFESAFDRDADFRIFIFEVAATLPVPDDEDREPEPENGDDEPNPNRIAVAELAESLSENNTITKPYVWMVILSAIVACIGLVRDNVAVIIGAMVIAPLLGPNMLLALATTLGDIKLARRALITNAAGVALALAVAVVLGVTLRFDPQTEQIALRAETSLYDVALALASGMAGALAFTTGVSSTLVGVMVAVALMPPLVAAGLLLGAGEWRMAFGAAILVATNIISINLAGVATFLYQRVRPKYWWEARRARRTVTAAAAVWALLLAALVGLIMLAQEQ